MPLEHSASKEAFSRNVSAEIRAGKPRDQALAIAYRIKRGRASGGAAPDPQDDRENAVTDARLRLDRALNERPSDNIANVAPGSRARAMGGLASGGAPAPWQTRAEARSMMHSGPINSIVPGRTDHHPMNVPSGAYVLPADHVSSLGQGNTQAGHAIINHMFGQSGPYGMGRNMGIKHGAGAPRPPGLKMRAAGGGTDDAGEPVPINAAGGEHVLTPEQVASVGGGDIKRGHQILDSWVVSNRKKHVDTLRKLPGPAKS